MSNIADLYEEVMNQAAAEKTAADVSAAEGAVFDRDFFEKVASGDEESVGTLNAFIEDARGEGYSDEQIEGAIESAMTEAGFVEGGGQDGDGDQQEEFEMKKAAAYLEGAEKAVEDILAGDMAKTAGVTADDLVEYELGHCYGQGYAETRQAMEEVVTKIAEAKAGIFRRAYEGAKRGARRYGQLMAGGEGATGVMGRIKGAPGERLKVWGARGGTAAGLGAGGAGAYYAAKKKKKK